MYPKTEALVTTTTYILLVSTQLFYQESSSHTFLPSTILPIHSFFATIFYASKFIFFTSKLLLIQMQIFVFAQTQSIQFFYLYLLPGWSQNILMIIPPPHSMSLVCPFMLLCCFTNSVSLLIQTQPLQFFLNILIFFLGEIGIFRHRGTRRGRRRVGPQASKIAGQFPRSCQKQPMVRCWGSHGTGDVLGVVLDTNVVWMLWRQGTSTRFWDLLSTPVQPTIHLRYKNTCLKHLISQRIIH